MTLGLFAGVSALVGGASLLARPDGGALHLPRTLLAHSPFHSFLVPGLLLFFVVGLSQLWSVALHVRRHPFAPLASLVAGGALVVWMVVEMLLLRTIEPLQVGYLLLGAVIAGRSVRQGRRAAPRPAHRPAHAS